MTVKRTLALLAIVSLILPAALAKGVPAKPEPLFESGAVYFVGDYTYSVAAADLDGDGDLDLAATVHDTYSIAVLFNDGEGSFGEAIYYSSPLNGHAICAADLDGDEDMDLAVAIDDHSLTSNLAVLLNNGDGSFAPYVSYETTYESTNVIAADFDGDLDQDLAVTSWGNFSVSILMNQGDGTFDPAVHYPSGGCELSDLFAVDMDGDLDLDVIAVGRLVNNVYVLLNEGDGTFEDAAAYPHGGDYAHSVTSDDFDGDGDNDVATANDFSSTLSILRNRGDGSLLPATIVDAKMNPVSIAAADLDNDGDPDLAVSNLGRTKPGGYTISFFENKNGVFRTGTEYATGDGPAGIIPADLDHDLDEDLVVAVAYEEGVETFFNTTRVSCCMIRGDADGSGQLDAMDIVFINEYLYEEGPEPPCMDEADVDGDGDVDEDDSIYIAAYLWEGGPPPVACPDAD